MDAWVDRAERESKAAEERWRREHRLLFEAVEVIDDDQEVRRLLVALEDLVGANYACGMYQFGA